MHFVIKFVISTFLFSCWMFYRFMVGSLSMTDIFTINRFNDYFEINYWVYFYENTSIISR